MSVPPTDIDAWADDEVGASARTGDDVQRAHAALRDMILELSLEPGRRISQAELSRLSGAGRTPLREALRMLEQEGLVTSAPNRGVTISPFDLDDLDSLYAYRVSMEPAAIRVSTPLMGDHDLLALDRVADAMTACIGQDDYGAFENHHRSFHELLLVGAQAGARKRIALDAERAERFRRVMVHREHGSLGFGEVEHRAILEAVRGGDGVRASHLLASHLARSAFQVAAQLDPTYDPVLTRTVLRMVLGEN